MRKMKKIIYYIYIVLNIAEGLEAVGQINIVYLL